MLTAISFPIPLATDVGSNRIYVTTEMIEEETAPAECPGTSAEPEAQAGFLCAYEEDSEKLGGLFFLKTQASGAFLVATLEAGGTVRGSFAVTAP